MIHQFIFAAPKPGLSRDAFASYWVNFHAPDFAAKIPQIRRYLVAIPLGLETGRDVPDFAGAAEIWLEPDEQIASMQTPQFLQGARADEPRWAAFWLTLGLDTDTTLLVGQPDPERGSAFAKLYILMKRTAASTRDEFRRRLLEDRRDGRRPNGLERHLIGFCRDGLYGVGEPRFDAVEVMAFRDAAALGGALDDGLRRQVRDGWPYVHDLYRFGFAATEHWVIRPGERDR